MVVNDEPERKKKSSVVAYLKVLLF